MPRGATLARNVAEDVVKQAENAARKPSIPKQRPFKLRPPPERPEPEQSPQPVWSAPFAAKVANWRAVPLTLMGLTALGMGIYTTSLVIQVRRAHEQGKTVTAIEQQNDVSGRYDYTADSFDAEVGLTETLMGVNRMRKRLARQCHGHVLEVSCGTGRNLGWYDIGKGGKVESLTLVDLSPQMVEICRKKWDALQKKNVVGLRIVRFVTGSALQPLPLALDGKKYDTIIQTMGLCSTREPAELLTNMARHLNDSDPEARILLLEHGRSYMPWLNRVLDTHAQQHAERTGCWRNRDIGELIEQTASHSGLEVVREKRYHLGTTSLFELKLKPGLLAKTEEKEKGDKEEVKRGPVWGRGWRALLESRSINDAKNGDGEKKD